MLATLFLVLGCTQDALSQQIGHIPEKHPKFISHSCTKAHGCTPVDTSIVLDATWRNLDEIGTGSSCLTNSLQLNKSICSSTAEACGERCALQGANYKQTGVDVSTVASIGSSGGSDAVTLNMFHEYNGNLVAVGPQIYLLAPNGKDYQVLHLLNREISFTVNTSAAPCGIDAAMYLTAMDPSGGRSAINPAGAAYGTGYCDSQCYTSYAFVNGVANLDGKGSCCNEMDLWEANSQATQTTVHPCKVEGFYACQGEKCSSVCDGTGCGFNPYSLGRHGLYGPGATVDTTRPFRVITKFITNNGTDKGDLIEVRRVYVQDWKVIGNPEVTLEHHQYDSISDPFCKAMHAKSTLGHGGVAQTGDALRRGMVLVMGIWNGGSGDLNWLDSEGAGPCGNAAGSPVNIKHKHPHTSVTFSDLRWGEIGSTY